MRFTLFICMQVMFLAFSLMAYGNNKLPTTLTYCYENKPVLPHFYGTGPNVPSEKPGPAIEIMQQLADLTEEVEINFVRFPWRRCLNDLALGRVDAVVGRYHPLRDKIAQYPKTEDGNLDNERSFSISNTCLVYREGEVFWDGANLSFDKPKSVTVPNGYGIISELLSKGFEIYEVPSMAKGHELLFKGRVNVSLSHCHMASVPDGFVENTIPISESIGYLMFSHQFYEKQLQLAHTLWDNLSKINTEQYYKKYSKMVNSLNDANDP
ncbi:hypothetical protein [Pseudoalteromonas sp.]|uniref:hypothetical protein n=1 Tax=Pseudoalteromonas sp. TaxID=53249 RepID=UPI0035661BB1